MSSNKFHLNEIRVEREAFDNSPILIAAGLRLSQRHGFLLEQKIAATLNTVCVSVGGDLSILLAGEVKSSDFWSLLHEEKLEEYRKVESTLGEQSISVKQRVLGYLLARNGRDKNIFQEAFLDFYQYFLGRSPFHRSLTLAFQETDECYRLFPEPGFTTLYRLDAISSHWADGQPLRCLEVPPVRGTDLGGGLLGFLVGVEELSNQNQSNEIILRENQNVHPQWFARVKRTKNSKSSYLIPIDYVLVKASYELLAECGDLQGFRDKTLMRPAIRLEQIKAWYSALFPNNALDLGLGRVAQSQLVFDLIEPTIYDGAKHQDAKSYLFPEHSLKFGPRQPENQESFDPYKGLSLFGPWDLRLKEKRPFNQIRPYVIYPNDQELRKRLVQLTKFFSEGGYTDAIKASPYDRSFKGFQKEFQVNFDIPGPESAIKDVETDEQYLEAADRIIEKWVAENLDPSRIVIVVFDSNEEDNFGSNSKGRILYARLKQKFVLAGLPSQMIDRGTLEKIKEVGKTLRFDQDSYFGHILWNLALNMYVKLGGRPWTLKRPLDNVNCLIGLGFTVNTLRLERPMYVGIANVFDELGEWVNITPDQEQITLEDLKAWYEGPRSFYQEETTTSKLSRDFTARVIKKSIEAYKNARGKAPLNIVIHKTGKIHEVEIQGAIDGIKDAGIQIGSTRLGFVSIIQDHGLRLYGEVGENWKDSYIVKRGIAEVLDKDRALLATTGRTEASSHLMGTPAPLELRIHRPSSSTLSSFGLADLNQYSIEQVCEHLLALTQLHWGSMSKEIRLPVTILYSQKVASISARAEISSPSKLLIHRPWFI